MRFLCLRRHNHINQFGLSKQGHAQVVQVISTKENVQSNHVMWEFLY
jgi:hypothetical protein